MKKIILLLAAAIIAVGLNSCSNNAEPQKWEYKILQIWGMDRGSFFSKGIQVPEDELNRLGDEGWELVDVYSRVETVHPNFGNSQYVTGLQPNTRTEAIFYVFKRPKTNAPKQGFAADTTLVEEVVAVEEVAVDTIAE
ncbi:MAG: DUF4177 domain-containing protein [Muribaculaceae bacterium]|nr:DUF4177 domain-containing protein [Muribaculaceae bacterium]